MAAENEPMRRVVLYSGGQVQSNARLHAAVLELARRGPARGRRRVRMTYVPFTIEGSGTYFHRFARRYRAFGGTDFGCLPLDRPELARAGPARERAAAELLASDVVYLAGGNTFHFLYHLRRSGLRSVIRRFAASGGVVVGMSAGAHLLSPDIALAGFPPFDRDENEVGLPRDRLAAIGLVDFELFPHYRHSPRYRKALAAWSRRSGRLLYACRDGSGLVVEGERVQAVGDVWTFDRGFERRLARVGD
ncbi:peptidase E [Myxococcota bacterium]|nr:peptidase E [Myxococcota bacterium]